MLLSKLQEYVKNAPASPGIYIFKGLLGKKLYVGKAARLKTRLGSYTKTKDGRILKMIESARSVELRPTNSDIEALILESQLIKSWRPHFNIVMRDDKQYFYVGFTSEEYPRLFLTHQPFAPKNKTDIKATYIGPFTDGSALKTTLRFLRRIFPYCTCMQKHKVFCLNYHIGKCLGFCCLKDNPKEFQKKAYKRNIRAIHQIFSGKKQQLAKDLHKEMVNYGKKGELEKALEWRNKIERLTRIFENARILKDLNEGGASNALAQLKDILNLDRTPYRVEGYDISNIQGAFATGAMVVFENGIPNKNEYRKFKIKYSGNTANDTAMLKEVLERRLRHENWAKPDLIIVDGGKGQVSTTLIALSKAGFKAPVIGLTKNEKHIGDHIYISHDKKSIDLKNLPVDVNNLILNVDSEAHRFAINYYRKRHQKSLPKVNRRLKF